MIDLVLSPDRFEPDELDRLAHMLTGPVHIEDVEVPTPIRETLLFVVLHLRAGNGVIVHHHPLPK